LPELHSEKWKINLMGLQKSHYTLNRYQAEPYRRWASGFTCLVFMIIGSAVAIRFKIADFWTCFGLCFLPILITYYPIFQFGVNQTKSGVFPPYGVWLGNVLLLAVGLSLLRNMTKR
jgi:lipopolysaccharide export system permease protein